MAIFTYGYNLAANVRTLVVPPSTSPQHVCVHNHEHNQNYEIFIGGDDVSLTNGMHAVATTTGTLTLYPNDALYAITDHDGASLRILVVR